MKFFYFFVLSPATEHMANIWAEYVFEDLF
jgi:hypothetical protein